MYYGKAEGVNTMGQYYLKMTGQWKEANNALKKLATELRPTLVAEVTSEGELVLDKLRGHIYSGDLGWSPLSPDTIRIKNGDSTILVETGTLANSFTVQKFDFGTGVNVFVGIPTGTSHPSGVSADTLMMWIEQGTSRMPARPLIAPTLDEVAQELPSKWTEVMSKFMGGL